MDLPSTRHRLLLSALVLTILAPSSRAAGSDSGEGRRPSRAVEDLGGDIGRPDDFKRFVEGSRAKRSDVDAPRAVAPGDERGPLAPLRLSRPRTGLRPEGAPIPPTAAAEGRRTAARRIVWTPDLAARKLAAVLGLGFMLVAAGMLETPVDSAAEPEASWAAPLPRSRPSPLPPPEPGLAPSRFANALADPIFIDTRMPVPTWRAISQREQRLIERWDASREKSLGLASLAEWIDAKGGVEGVDAPLLKAKLRRDA